MSFLTTSSAPRTPFLANFRLVDNPPAMWGQMRRFYTTFSLTSRGCWPSFISRLGYSDVRTRADSPRHSRFAHSESRLSGLALRLRHSAAHRTDFTGSLGDRTGRALPRAVSTCAAGIVEGSRSEERRVGKECRWRWVRGC